MCYTQTLSYITVFLLKVCVFFLNVIQKFRTSEFEVLLSTNPSFSHTLFRQKLALLYTYISPHSHDICLFSQFVLGTGFISVYCLTGLVQKHLDKRNDRLRIAIAIQCLLVGGVARVTSTIVTPHTIEHSPAQSAIQNQDHNSAQQPCVEIQI